MRASQSSTIEADLGGQSGIFSFCLAPLKVFYSWQQP